MPHEGRVYFGLSGEFEPSELTALLGINPTKTTARGERNPALNIPCCGMWQYSTETVIEDYIDIYEMSESVISALEPFSDRIKDAMRSMNLCGVLQVVLYLSMDDSLPTPAIGMSERTVNFVASVGASIDIDTYRIG